MKRLAHIWLLAAATLLTAPALADPLAAPGDTRLRHDLELLNDRGAINVTLTAWPVPLGDIYQAIDEPDLSRLNTSELAALHRVREHLAWELDPDEFRFRFGLAGAAEPRAIRTFENTPRSEGEATVGLSWFGERFAMNLQAQYAANPFDGEEFRPDGSYVGVALGNWLLTAGWQDRWWGPGRDGSLILGSNARPAPGVEFRRNSSKPFKTKWLRWMGPWTLTTFMSQLDDERYIDDTLVFGIRGSMRPPRTGLEIGISRTAQWCGDGRPCDGGTFWDLLIGNDNRGVNVDPDDEPGNQLGGFDIRWRLPKQIPLAVYMQWIGEDGRGGGGAIGSWLRQAGLEFWGTVGRLSHRTHFEVSETTCRQGGFGFSDPVPDCGYEHSIYLTGYRYNGRALAHPSDGDSRSYSIGSTLVQSGGQVWNVSLRQMEINRLSGASDSRHSISATPIDMTDVQVSYENLTRFGRFHAGLGYSRSEFLATDATESDVAVFLRWSNQ